MTVMERCPICERGEPLDVIATLDTTWVTAQKVAALPGYVCVVARRHVVEPFELAREDGAAFWDEAMSVARAVAACTNPRKMNYEIHGNTIPHLHLHLFPRYAGDPFEGRPIDGSETRFVRTDADLERLRAAVATANRF